MKHYATHIRTRTPQSLPIPELHREMKPNRAGGWGFEVSDATLLDRFLILGTEEPSYYASSRDLTMGVVTCIDRLIEQGEGKLAVDHAVEISESGRAPKNEPALLAVAMVAKRGSLEERRYAANAVAKVARTYTHLAFYTEALEAVGEQGAGWGRLTKWTIADWFGSKNWDSVAYQLIKYRQRAGWTARDHLRLAHLKPVADGDPNNLLGWAVGKGTSTHPLIRAYEAVQEAEIPMAIAALITEFRLPWEAIPSRWAKDLVVQEALLEQMPPSAMLRQLGRLTAIGLLTKDSHGTRVVVDCLQNATRLARARVHPMAIYLAMRTYGAGRGVRGSLRWSPVPEIMAVLDRAFYAAFATAKGSGVAQLVALDVSASMTNGGIAGVPGLQAAEMAGVMGFVTAKLEPQANIVAFNTETWPLDLRGAETIGQAARVYEAAFERWGGGTDCASPIRWAEHNLPGLGGIVVYTDDEPWYGPEHPIEAVSRYRDVHGTRTKLVSCAMVAHDYSIAPRDDAGSMAVIGMDAATPGIIADFLGS